MRYVNRQSTDPDSILPEDGRSAISGVNGSDQAVAVLSRDLFFGMRIRNALKQLGYEMALSGDEAAFIRNLQESENHPVLGLLDFNQPVDWNTLSGALTGKVPVIAFGSHTAIEEFRKAKAAGATRVISNGEFSRTLPDLIEKYRR